MFERRSVRGLAFVHRNGCWLLVVGRWRNPRFAVSWVYSARRGRELSESLTTHLGVADDLLLTTCD
jgi:hypothetical protein